MLGAKKIPKRQRRREIAIAIAQAADKLVFTNHAEIRLEERFNKTGYNIKKTEKVLRQNIVKGLLHGIVKYNSHYKCYKLYSERGIHIIGKDGKIVTVMSENRGSVLDPYYEDIDDEQRKKLMKKIGLLDLYEMWQKRDYYFMRRKTAVEKKKKEL